MSNRSRFCALLAMMLMASSLAYAATIDAKPHKGFGRINFNFAEPAKLKASADGTTATLQFSEPVSESPAAIKNAMPGYVSNATLSADKKSVTLTMNKAYRIRQFVSGNSVGIDLIGEATQSAASTAVELKKPETPKETAARTPASSSKPAPTKTPPAKSQPAQKATAEKSKSEKPAAKKEASPEQPDVLTTKKAPPANAKTAAANPLAKASPSAAGQPDLLTTKEPAPPTAEEKTAIAAHPAAAAQDPVLSSRHDAPEAQKEPTVTLPEAPAAASLSTKDEPAPAPAATHETNADHAMMTTKKPAETTPQETSAPPPETAAPAKPAAAPTASLQAQISNDPKSPFLVTARTTNGESTLNFPWTERTGAAVFERARDIWVVFSQGKDVNAGLLRTIMPRQVVNVTQYAYEGNTVLRLATDGNVHARVAQDKGGYGWNVTIGTTSAPPPVDTSLSADSLEGTMRLVLGVFDVAPTVRFYDPSVGDLLMVIPSFENGRGVANERNFPEFSVLPSNQGIALTSKRSDLSLSQTRSGLILSSKEGLVLSDSLPMLAGAKPTAGSSLNSGVMIPYEQWYVPADKFLDTGMTRLQNFAAATKAAKADSLMELVKLYLSAGRGPEATGVLDLIHTQYPEYYTTNKLALLSAAAHVMQDHIDSAAKDLDAPEIAELEEAMLWREAVALSAPPASTAQKLLTPVPVSDSAANTPPAPAADGAPAAAPAPTAPAVQKPILHYIKYNKPFIRFYPPRIRQRLAVLAADAYINDGQQEKALAVYDVLIHDGILEPVKHEAEFALGAVAEKKAELVQALEIYDRLSKQTENPGIAARARYAAAMLRYHKSKISAEDTAEILENARMSWRGDATERAMLTSLIDIYKELKRYDEVLRTQKAVLEAFPADPETLAIAGDMGVLFNQIFMEGLADEMPPLKALSLFYEFRDLTPLGESGDQIIQRLADRLAAFDLLDRATQLLEHQIKFRIGGEQRSKVGARLALLYLLNHQPKEALSVLEVTNYGGNTPELQLQRQQLTAQALTKLGKPEEALGVLYNDKTKTGAMLRLDVLWSMQDWPNIVNRAEDILSERPTLTEPLTTQETEVLLKLALAYSFEGDYTQLRYLKDYYSSLVPDSGYKQILEFITNDTNPLDPDDFALLAQQISRTEGFLGTFKEKIAEGKLSEAVK